MPGPIDPDDDPIGVALDPGLVLPGRIAHWAVVDGDRPFLAEVGGRAGTDPGGRTATHTGGRTATYAGVADGMRRWASVLSGRGVRAGDRVASFLPPSIDAHLVWLASACLGALEVSVNPELRGPLLDHVLADAAPALCVVRADQRDLVPHGIPALVTDEDPAAGAPAAEIGRWPAPTDPCCVLYTSGTTGPAKGVVIPWAQLGATIGRIPRRLLSGDDAVYAPWPMFHVTGRSPLPAMADVGGRVVLRERVSIGDFWSDIVGHRCTSTTIGAIAALIVETDAPPAHPLRWVFMAARGELSLRVQDKFGVEVIGNYGSTELGFPILNRHLDAATADAAGWPRPGYRTRVLVDGAEVADGTPGELAISGASRAVMFSGYVGVDGDPLEDGWFRTGDLVVRRPDGAIVFVDRMRDTIRRFGENISSVAVEAIVNADAEVRESAALASPSDVCGEEVLLVVAPATVDPAALFGRLQHVLPRHALPAYVAVRPELPKTPTGKVAKRELRVRASDADVWESPAAARRHQPRRG